jgi:hypothetical protein
MVLALMVVLAQLPPGVEAKTVVEKHALACPARSQSSFCDDPSIVMPTIDPSGDLDKVTFVGKKPGRTTCSCGLNQGFRTVWQITVISNEAGVELAAKRVADVAMARVAQATPRDF